MKHTVIYALGSLAIAMMIYGAAELVKVNCVLNIHYPQVSAPAPALSKEFESQYVLRVVQQSYDNNHLEKKPPLSFL